MSLTALEPLDSSWQPARLVVLDDRRLQMDRADHRSLAGCSLHTSAPGGKSPLGRGGGAAQRALGVLSVFPVESGGGDYVPAWPPLARTCQPTCPKNGETRGCRLPGSQEDHLGRAGGGGSRTLMWTQRVESVFRISRPGFPGIFDRFDSENQWDGIVVFVRF